MLERGVPIARLVGLSSTSQSLEADQARLERLERAGILRRGASDASWLAREEPIEALSVGLAAALAADREDRF